MHCPHPESNVHRHHQPSLPIALLLGLLLVAAAIPAAAEVDDSGDEKPAASETSSTPAEDAGTGESPLFERLRVVAGPVREIPGAVTVVDEEQLQRHEYTDVNRILRLVPGVNLQEEDGYGLRPNIGLRGTGVERSSRITLLEDGVLIAPAPYAAPSAYYFPTVGRMEGIEVRKGSASIRQGPYTTGGAINLISSSIPNEFGGRVNLSLGEDDTVRGRARVGQKIGNFGWLFETFRMNTNGFKRIDGGGDTGFRLEDYLGKFSFTTGPNARRFQAVELKLGKTEQDGEETYTGLTQADFATDPFRRYAASREDGIVTDHEQVQLRHMVRLGKSVDLTTTIYNNDFFRNWRKLERVQGQSITSVLDDPVMFAAELDIVRGSVDSGPDALSIRNNRREYFSRGIQSVLGLQWGSRTTHDLEIGVRYHQDEEDRFQEEDGFQITGGRLVQTSSGMPGSQANRLNQARALAWFVQDTIAIGRRIKLTPGFRVEHINFSRIDYGTLDPDRTGIDRVRRDNDVDEFIPGMGVTYALSESDVIFGGVHRGFSPPGPGANRATDPEESTNYEFGYRRTRGALNLEAVAFFSDYDNLLGADTVSGGGSGTGDLFNGGAAAVAGIEAGVGYDLGAPTGSRFSIPVDFSVTYTEAEFRNSFYSGYGPWGNVSTGDELPYLPELQTSIAVGLVDDQWSMFTNLTYSEEMRTAAGAGDPLRNEATDSYFLVDLSGSYHLRDNLRLTAQIRNLTDRAYVAARRPAGLRPTLPRTVLIGVSFDF